MANFIYKYYQKFYILTNGLFLYELQIINQFLIFMNIWYVFEAWLW